MSGLVSRARRISALAILLAAVVASPGCASTEEEGEETDTAVGPLCAMFDAPDTQPMRIQVVNDSAATVTIYDDCSEAGLVKGVDGISIDDVSLRTYGNCTDKIAGSSNCQADCWGSQGIAIDPGETWEFAWSGLLMPFPEGLSGDDAWMHMPAECDPSGCGHGDDVQCRPLVALQPGQHRLRVHDSAGSIGSVDFTSPTDVITVELR